MSDILKLECDCGCCSGLTFRYEEFDADKPGEIYISFTHGFYEATQKPLRSYLRVAARLMRPRNRWIGGIVVSRTDMEKIIDFLKMHPCNRDKQVNEGTLKLFPICDPNDVGTPSELYELLLYGIMPRKDVLLGKMHRAGEIVLNEKYRKCLVGRFESALI